MLEQFLQEINDKVERLVSGLPIDQSEIYNAKMLLKSKQAALRTNARLQTDREVHTRQKTKTLLSDKQRTNGNQLPTRPTLEKTLLGSY